MAISGFALSENRVKLVILARRNVIRVHPSHIFVVILVFIDFTLGDVHLLSVIDELFELLGLGLLLGLDELHLLFVLFFELKNFFLCLAYFLILFLALGCVFNSL
jgi:hypothetical protein